MLDEVPQSLIREINIRIYDMTTNETSYGASQYWFPKKVHQVSGCGPVASAIITMFLARYNSNQYSQLVTHNSYFDETMSRRFIGTKEQMIKHMIECRRFVRPGPFGLTSAEKFVEYTKNFAKLRGIELKAEIAPYLNFSDLEYTKNLEHFMISYLNRGLPIALLILLNPVKVLDEFTWHWMIITSTYIENNQRYVALSSWGKRYTFLFKDIVSSTNLTKNVKMVVFS